MNTSVPQHTTDQIEVPKLTQSSQHTKLFLIISVILIFMLATIGSLIYFRVSRNYQSILRQTVTDPDISQKYPTNWKTYTGRFFRFKYPSTWIDNTKPLDGNAVQFNISPQTTFSVDAQSSDYQRWVREYETELNSKGQAVQIKGLDGEKIITEGKNIITNDNTIQERIIYIIKGIPGVASWYGIFIEGNKQNINESEINQVINTISFNPNPPPPTPTPTLPTPDIAVQGNNKLYTDKLYRFSLTFPSGWQLTYNAPESYAYVKPPPESFILKYNNSSITFNANYEGDYCEDQCTSKSITTVSGLQGRKIYQGGNLSGSGYVDVFTVGSNTLVFWVSAGSAVEGNTVDSILNTLTLTK